ncbi:MAG: DegQ family serine endoprotease [SAR324 cluster bacterium]|nr:DegQ family serine endoprotease [SAR324 cluster bacterium]MCZ6841937.1 DegQ family serine endoprotease [SAR324 cluster bacterium]
MNVLKARGCLIATALAIVLGIGAFSGAAMADVTDDIKALQRASKARAAIIKRISPAVVHIRVEKTVKGSEQPQEPSQDFFDDEFFRRFFQPRMPREFKQRGLGSGSIVDKRGYIITNNHVVAGADKITVKLPDGRQFEAKLVGADRPTDLAVIKIEGKDLPVANFGDSDELEVGESVIAIGNPFGLEQTITAGIVSAKGRSQVGLTDYEDFIQTDASINPGNSGGPLVNLKGELVGVNTAIFSRTGGNQGIGFAIPINMVRSVMQSLIDTGKVTRGFLGVVIQNVTQEIAEALDIKVKSGVLIANVGEDTPAGKSGILQGDVITKFNQRAVTDSNELRNAVAAVKPGTSVPVNLTRDGEDMKLMVKVGEQPEDMRAAISGRRAPGPGRQGRESDASPERELGLVLRPLTRELAEQLGYVGLSGVLIVEVKPNSPAAEANLRPRSLIVEVDRKHVRNIQDFRRIYGSAPKGKQVLFLLQLGQMTQFVAVKKP